MIGLKNKGVVVASTCSLRSDVAAIKHADVSFAAGLDGTDFAR